MSKPGASMGMIFTALKKVRDLTTRVTELEAELKRVKAAIEQSVRLEEEAPGFGHAASKAVRGEAVDAIEHVLYSKKKQT